MALGNKTLDDLLGPISEQFGRKSVAAAIKVPEWEFKAQRVTDGLSAAQLVDLFESEAAKIRVQAKRCAKADLAKAIAEIVGAGEPESGEACTVVCADEEAFAEAGLYDALKACEKVSDVHVWDETAGDANVQKARYATYGVTYAKAGIAESATVVQPTYPKCGRAISLLPLVHIAVVDAATIVPTMLEVMQAYAADGKLPSQVCFISGPSATADIELVRVEGVHGPMYVHYVIVE